MTRVVVAPDSFKGSMSAREVAHHLAVGLRAAAPGTVVDELPVADGGEGTVDAAVAAGFARRSSEVRGPTGQPVVADHAVRDGVAVVELAAASGLGRLPGGRPEPLSASTYGTGQQLAAALDARCTRIVLGVGGSASTDGGSGLLQALGARLLDRSGRLVVPGGAGLLDVDVVDLSGLDPRWATVELVLASDVDNPLLGPEGAAAVYAPQKGAMPAGVEQLERALSRWCDAVERARPGAAEIAAAAGAGAAGGAGFAALAVLGARRASGVQVVADLVGLPARTHGADLVVTGEGSLDPQTGRGKAPAGVARLASAAGVLVVAVCGRLALVPDDVTRLGFAAAYPLTSLEPDEDRCRAHPGPLLEQLGRVVAERHLATRPGG